MDTVGQDAPPPAIGSEAKRDDGNRQEKQGNFPSSSDLPEDPRSGSAKARGDVRSAQTRGHACLSIIRIANGRN
jgi:hypothetical protein